MLMVHDPDGIQVCSSVTVLADAELECRIDTADCADLRWRVGSEEFVLTVQQPVLRELARQAEKALTVLDSFEQLETAGTPTGRGRIRQGHGLEVIPPEAAWRDYEMTTRAR